MARNEEKAQSMLHRYLRSKQGNNSGIGGSSSQYEKRRPYLSTICDDVDEAVRWQRQVISEIRGRVNDIQSVGLPQERVRELNDQINKLMRERKHWGRRIRQLGGNCEEENDVFGTQRKMKGKRRRDGEEGGVFEHEGYMYFGEARNLPGVKQLIEAEKTNQNQRASQQDEQEEEEDLKCLQTRCGAFYYDGVIQRDEDEDERRIRRGMECEEEEFEKSVSDKRISDWEIVKEKQGDSHYGPDEEWDETYLQATGGGGGDDDDYRVLRLELLQLEARKGEALQLLKNTL